MKWPNLTAAVFITLFFLACTEQPPVTSFLLDADSYEIGGAYDVGSVEEYDPACDTIPQ